MTTPTTDVRKAEERVIEAARKWNQGKQSLRFLEKTPELALREALEQLDAARSSPPAEGGVSEAEIRADYHDEIVRLEKRMETLNRGVLAQGETGLGRLWERDIDGDAIIEPRPHPWVPRTKAPPAKSGEEEKP